MANQSVLERGFEALVFAARHWELVDWLEAHWNEEADEAAAVLELAAKAGFDSDSAKKIADICTGSRASTLRQIVLSYPEQGRKVVDMTLKELRGALSQTRCQCGEAKKLRWNSNWLENEFAIRPRQKRDQGGVLYIGCSIEQIPRKRDEQVTKDVCLVSYIWLKSPSGVLLARNSKSLGPLLRKISEPMLESSWPRTIVLSATSILSKANDAFEFDLPGAIAECQSIPAKLTADHIEELYGAALAGR